VSGFAGANRFQPFGRGSLNSPLDGIVRAKWLEHRTRGVGLLNNPLYVGRQVFNRNSFVRDPDTGTRRAPAKDEQEWVETVRVVRCEPVSAKIRCLTGKIEGNLSIGVTITGSETVRGAEFRDSTSKLSTLWTGNSFCRTANYHSETATDYFRPWHCHLWTPPLIASGFDGRKRVGFAVIYPASQCSILFAAGPDGIRGSAPSQTSELEARTLPRI
jgi:hypothetical protein